MTMLCVPIQVNGVEAALADALQAAERGADIIELRIDGWFDPASPDADAGAVRRLVESCPLPVIVTCRASAEGGFFEGDEADRVALLRSLMARGRAHRRASISRPPRSMRLPRCGPRFGLLRARARRASRG